MKRLLLVGLFVFGNIGLIAENAQFTDQQLIDSAFVQSEMFIYDIMSELKNYKDINSWDDVKSFAFYLHDVNENFQTIIKDTLNAPEFVCLEITTLEEILNFVGALEVMQDILYRLVQTSQEMQKEVNLLQIEDDFNSWIQVIDAVENIKVD